MLYEYMVRSKLPPYEVYKLHKKVMDVVCGGGQGLNTEASRPLWRSMADGSGGSMLLVRSSQPPLGKVTRINEQTLSLKQGQLCKFNCRLNLSARVWVDHPLKARGVKKVERSLGPEEVQPWFRQLLSGSGMALQNAAIVSQSRVSLKRNHFINAADILFIARIVDPALAEVAYQRGIGRKKAFGFGLLL
nr:type I-E CRISPR-associated protein Cas6/Cse3/CasE [Endozoicomonas sp. ONNA2]